MTNSTTPPNADLISTIATLAGKRKWQVMTAESCTGGMLAAALTTIAGSSAWFRGGVVSYSNALKQSLLNVSANTLKQHGAVSAETAQEMCDGLCMLGADAGASITGIAGPGGGSDDKPVGLVYFGFFTPQHSEIQEQKFNKDNSREKIREQATHHALQRLAELLKEAA